MYIGLFVNTCIDNCAYRYIMIYHWDYASSSMACRNDKLTSRMTLQVTTFARKAATEAGPKAST